MAKGINSLLLVLVLLISATVICTAQPTPGGFPGTVPGVGPSYLPGGQPPVWPGSSGGFPGTVPGVGPSYPPGGQPPVGPGSSEGFPGTVPGSQSGNEHPATGPDAMQPNEAPPASTGKVVTTLHNKQALNSQEIMANFGSEPQSNSATGATGSEQRAYGVYPASASWMVIPTGIQYWAFYNGMWTQGPSAVFFNQNMNLLLSNDQAQNIWAYELYPNNWPNWSYWGYRWAGNYNAWFIGDMRGWHLCAIWGDRSGWSNVLWIYVW